MNFIDGFLEVLGLAPAADTVPDRGHMYLAYATMPATPAIPNEDEGTPVFLAEPGTCLVAVARGVRQPHLAVVRCGLAIYSVSVRAPYPLHVDEIFPAGGPAEARVTLEGEAGGRRVSYEAILRHV